MSGKDNVQKAAIAFGFALEKVMAYSGNPALAMASSAMPVFTDILVELVQGDPRTNVWVQLEQRFDERISTVVTSQHQGILLAPVNQMQALMKKKNITKDDVNLFILSYKPLFLPQTFERTVRSTS